MSSQSTTPFPLGVYVGGPDGSDSTAEVGFESSFNNFTSTIGAQPTYFDTYVDYTQTISEWASDAGWEAWSDAQSPDTKNLTPVIGLPLASINSSAGTADSQYQAVAAGNYDGIYQSIVQSYAANGFTNLVFRPGWEMNIEGPTYAGDTPQDQADWVAAYQHVYTILHQEGAALGVDVSVVWNPGVTSYSNVEATNTLYPGSAYVDAIGADDYADIYPYPDGTNSSGQVTYHDWDTGGEDTSLAQFIADPVNREHYWTDPAANEWSNDGSGGHALSLDQLIAFAESQGKPFAIPETGAGSSGGTDVFDDAAFPQWLAGQLTAAEAQGEKIDFVSLWDSDYGGAYSFSNPSDGKPAEAAAWAQYFGDQTTTVASSSTTEASSNATTTAATPVVVESSGSDILTLEVSEDAYQGDAQYEVVVDGYEVGGNYTATASHAVGQINTQTITGSWGNGPHTVAIQFINDAYGGSPSTDRNLYINSVSYDGTQVTSGTVEQAANGVVSFTVPATNVLTLDLAEDAYQGDAQFVISVDGTIVGQPTTVTASKSAGASQAFNVGGLTAGTHDIGVTFLNDAYGGSPTLDRNLYVTGAQLNGTTLSSSAWTAALDSNGTQSFSLIVPP